MERLPLAEAQRRVTTLQSWLAAEGVDAVFVLQLADLVYFTGTSQMGLLCISPSGEPVFMVQKSVSRARLESPWPGIGPMGGLRFVPDMLASAGVRNLRRIGLELDVLPAALFLRLKSVFPDAEFVDASDAIRRVRMIKSDWEVARIREAAGQVDRALSRLPEWLVPGRTELEIAAELERFLRREGHQGITRMRSFNCDISYGTVSAGPSASFPTSFPGPVGFEGLYPAVPNGPGRRAVRQGEPVMVDIVGGYDGYIADITRVFCIGEPDRELRAAQDFVAELIEEVESLLRPGTNCSHIFEHVIGRVEESPYAAGFMGVDDSHVRFIGHGVGLELDEWPVLAKGFDVDLEPGMTIAIEPKIFFAGRGGAGIEDTYLVTSSGFERLTSCPRELRIVPAPPAEPPQ